MTAAAIPFAGDEEEAAEREKLLKVQPIGGRSRGGGSSWQSLARGTRSIECDYLNGEIVLLGRMFGVPTPVNEMLQRLAAVAAADGKPPGSMNITDLEQMVGDLAKQER